MASTWRTFSSVRARLEPTVMRIASWVKPWSVCGTNSPHHRRERQKPAEARAAQREHDGAVAARPSRTPSGWQGARSAAQHVHAVVDRADQAAPRRGCGGAGARRVMDQASGRRASGRA